MSLSEQAILEQDKNIVSNIVQDILCEQISIEKTELNLDLYIYEDLKIDSLDLVEIIKQIEEKFDIKIDDSKILYMNTLEEFIDFTLQTIYMKHGFEYLQNKQF
uniref:Acyl carrier protein n=1 Tax=Cyanophora paradoxa TaxID=2762 RepID=ACP_CYAPA|nr:acyl carrier protein [Cyanophora paradoxa]P48078.1 RecName: Full=Acyl carrier protein; Short=ACP [Cyanophora paradoxa]AAA81177.1 acyl carrier protein [Cyanophora paradoxa]